MKPSQIHHIVERNAALLICGILIVAIWGGLAQVLPVVAGKLPAQSAQVPYTAMQLAGREVYLRESCALCHTQQVRPLVAEIRRYGPYSRPSEFIYDRPFLWGSKRTGPDLHRLAGKYSDAWHRIHLLDPREVVPGSIMPAYPWLDEAPVDIVQTQKLMLGLRVVGIEYSNEQVAAASAELASATEMDALIAYLQSLGAIEPTEAESW